jgi:hypothetical protein
MSPNLPMVNPLVKVQVFPKAAAKHTPWIIHGKAVSGLVPNAQAMIAKSLALAILPPLPNSDSVDLAVKTITISASLMDSIYLFPSLPLMAKAPVALLPAPHFPAALTT